jgi:hypothetical protein
VPTLPDWAHWDLLTCERRPRIATANLLNFWELIVRDMEAAAY